MSYEGSNTTSVQKAIVHLKPRSHVENIHKYLTTIVL